MTATHNQSIRQKITLVIMTISSFTLLVACVALLGFQAWTIKWNFMRELSVTGEMVAGNVAVAAMFNDEEKAAQILGGLKALPEVTSATLSLADGTELAHWGASNDTAVFPEGAYAEGFHTDGNLMLLAQPVSREGKQLGRLYIRADFRSAYAGLLWLYGGILAGVLVTSLFLAFLLSRRLQHLVTAPILRLTATARQIAGAKDYTVRASKTVSDEVGTLTDAFNQMLEQIQAQDSALQSAQLELKKQLAALETSRLAGMAEVASSVLHNVGNVLNSVNVSGNVLNERLRGSKVAALARTAALIDENRGNFSDFVANDPRGKLIPDLVSKIAHALAEEQHELLAEATVINSHISHIKEIIAMQQSYSCAGGVIEPHRVEEVVDCALRINSASMARHDIRVVQDYEGVPPVQVDRHKAMQILVNLLTNAKHALNESVQDEKALTIKIRNNGGHFVKIIVEDNGVGIPRENLTRIFAYGFTTKRYGHGFGLHHSALAATEMGGSLHARSEGPGRGATFTLELPIVAPPGRS